MSEAFVNGRASEPSEEAAIADIRPMVAQKAKGNWGVIVFSIVLVLGGTTLFNALNSSRKAARAPATALTPPPSEAGQISAPAALALPARFSPVQEARTQPPRLASNVPISNGAPRAIAPAPRTVPIARADTLPFGPPVPPTSPLPSLDLPPRPQVVFENRSAVNTNPSNAIKEGGEAERVKAGRFINPSLTIPKGTVIPAVLETALDSTRAGGVRALVQRDVKSFDGTRILIQRGSRLYGEYEASLEQGQNRALVQWTRLIRPDGVTIALNSPASDPLGRAGIRGKVDSKFLERFGGAILQSVLDIGVGLATREIGDGVIVALPGSTQNVGVNNRQNVVPTLKVRHGTSVSVFVARDLDFSTVES